MFPFLSRPAKALTLLLALSSFLGARVHAAVGDVLFEDNFVELDASFPASETLNVEDGSMYMKLDVNQWFRQLYQSAVFDDVDVTVQVQLPDMSAEEGASAGLMFWAKSVDEFYLLEISDSGTYSVRNLTASRSLRPISWRQSEAINTEPGATNELRVVTIGNRATIFINGQQLATIKGRAPEGGSLVGMFTETFDHPVESRFRTFRVVEAAAPTTEDPADQPGVIAADDFAMFDPAWGPESGWFGVKDGKLFIDFNASESYARLYESQTVTGHVDATVTVSLTGGGGETAAGAALVFWGNTYDDYFSLNVYENGNIAVYRKLKDRWLAPMAVKPAPEGANVDLSAGVTLRVVTAGRKATLYINGVEAGTFTGQPPQGDSLIGLYGQSGDAACVTLFDDLMVRSTSTN